MSDEQGDQPYWCCPHCCGTDLKVYYQEAYYAPIDHHIRDQPAPLHERRGYVGDDYEHLTVDCASCHRENIKPTTALECEARAIVKEEGV